MIQTNRTKQQGFTLVELTLAIAFIGFLVLFTVIATLQVMRTYDKGLAVKEINQMTRVILDDIGRSVRSSSYTAINTTPNDESPTQSRICIGGVSYVWNIGNQAVNKYTSGSTISFARVNDPGSALCQKVSGAYPNVDSSKATSLLLGSRVWVQKLTLTRNAASNLATVTMQLSTTDDLVNPALETLTDGSVRCKGQTGDQFCAVATLTTTVAMRGDE